MRQLLKGLAFAAAVFSSIAASPTWAGEILLAGDSNIFNSGNAGNQQFFQNVFNGKSVANFSSVTLANEGTSATVTNFGVATLVTSASLSGKDFLLFCFNQTSVAGSKLTPIVDFYNNGGSLFLFGEGNTGFTSNNTTVNTILNAVGSTMSLSTSQNFKGPGFATISVVGSRPYAAGVTQWTTAYASAINLGSGQAVISGTTDNGFGIAVAREGDPVSVSEPAAGLLLVLGLLGITARQRRGMLR